MGIKKAFRETVAWYSIALAAAGCDQPAQRYRQAAKAEVSPQYKVNMTTHEGLSIINV